MTQAFHNRLQQQDMLQILIAYFAILLFVLAINWPQSSGVANDSWFVIVQAKVAIMALLGLFYGASLSARSHQDRLVTLLLLLSVCWLSLPLEIASYAASYPSVPLGMSLLMPSFELIAYFGIGLLAGKLLDILRLKVLLPLAIPLVLIGLIALDIWTGLALFNPLSGSLSPSLSHLISLGLMVVASLPFYLRGKMMEPA